MSLAASEAVEKVEVERGDTVHLLEAGELTDDETVAATWLHARLMGQSPNQVIAREQGITAAAAAQRVARLRKADPPLIPPATKKGARK